MPEHISLLHYILYRLGLNQLIDGHTLSHHHLGYKQTEPLFASLLIMAFILYFSWEASQRYKLRSAATDPEAELTVSSFFEIFFEFFYNTAADVMGTKSAKRFFPIIGASAIFIFISNAIGLIPGFLPPTSNLNITAGCAVLVFLAFNYYGLRENGIDYLKHMAGWGMFPKWWQNLLLASLMFPIEFISACVRPITLAIRLMLNIAVDHLLVSIFMGLFAIALPLPIMMLGIIVICVQTLVFCLLTSIYIGLATEHAEDHH
jgi:F-type H+-transporting ATPase subunit a